jgi:RNA 3'-terminal phosphate cyclase (ATP)
MIELDGSMGEGGGQVLRSSLALSLLTGLPFHLTNVRARRAKPGLQPQHLMSVRAAAQVGNATLRGASLGSGDLVFEPGEVVAGKYNFNIGTAGATSLVLHTVYLPLALRGNGPSELTFQGGTHVSHSPCYHFLETTWVAYLERFGLRIGLKMRRPGFYPRGGGIVEATVPAVPQLIGYKPGDRGTVKRATGFGAVAALDQGIARRMVRRATYRLREAGLEVALREESWDGGPGAVLAVALETGGPTPLFFGIGARGKPAEAVADEAVDQALTYLSAGPALVDEHSADQIVLPLVLAPDRSEFGVARVTAHLQTNIEVIGRFVDREIVLEGAEGEPGRVRIAAG